MSKKKYTKTEVIKLIHLYRDYECLWKPSCKAYLKNDLKIQALEKIAEEFNVSSEEIKKKLRCLRATYVHEKRKINRRMKADPNGTYVPSLFWFEHMKFLDQAIVMRKARNEKTLAEKDIKIEKDDSPKEDFEEDSSRLNTPTPDCTIDANLEQMILQSPVKDKYASIISKLVEAAQTQLPEEDVLTAFAKSICVQLKSIPLIEAFKLMSDIQNMVSKRCVEILTGPQLPTSTFNFIPSSPSNSEASLSRQHT